jgi:ABC-2 type transport system ATP-binding protein
VEGPRQWLAFPATESAAPLVARVAARYPLMDLSVREPDIETVIAKMYAERADGRGVDLGLTSDRVSDLDRDLTSDPASDRGSDRGSDRASDRASDPDPDPESGRTSGRTGGEGSRLPH